MNKFYVKKYLALVLEKTGINDKNIKSLHENFENDFIRIINYHKVPAESLENFENQIRWYSEYFENVTYNMLGDFLNSKCHFENKPGLVITFDDGYADNYKNAFPVLLKHGFTGWYFVSPALLNTENYMTADQLKEMAEKGHIIGCHTFSHHRMEPSDSEDLLKNEILDSKEKLMDMLGCRVDAFAWCGGEECHYTKSGADWIKKSGYTYSMMTNSFPVLHGSNPMQLQRTNIEADWHMSLVKFQLSGMIDMRFRKRRIRVNELTK